MVLNKNAASPKPTGRFGDRRMEVIMGRLLQVGVLLASFVMLIGGILYTRAHHSETPDFRVFSSEPQNLRHLTGIIAGIKNLDSAAVIQLAVLLLIATPVARVVFALIGFTIERDKLYIVVSSMVLAVLLFGFLRSQ